jgi:polysaccharide export outer membrane protein
MRLLSLLVLLSSALSLAACARQAPRYAAVPMAQADLDMRMYGAPQPRAYAVQQQPRSYVAQPPQSYVVQQPQSYVVRRAAQAVPVAVNFDDGPYTLDSGDKLRIVVFGQDTLSNNYIVDAEGQVSLPLIGVVNARGLTTAQLSAAIAGRLKQNYVRDPSVAVEIETYRPFFVLGEVTFPGQYPYVPNMTVENAIAIAGGFTPRASKDRVTVTRKVQGVPTRFTLPLRYPLRPGDTIAISERWF